MDQERQLQATSESCHGVQYGHGVPLRASLKDAPVREERGLVAEAAAEIERYWETVPRVVLMLGTGMGPFAHQISADVTIPYADSARRASTTAL